MNKLIAIVGMCGSGKSQATDELEHQGWKKIYFGGVTYKKMQEEAKNMNLEEQKGKAMSRVLVKKDDAASNQNNSSSGFISILLLTLGVGFISGVVSVLAYLFISR